MAPGLDAVPAERTQPRFTPPAAAPAPPPAAPLPAPAPPPPSAAPRTEPRRREVERRPVGYALIADVAVRLLEIADRALPLLDAEAGPGLPPPLLKGLLRQTIDEAVFDVDWQRRLEHVLAERETPARRGLVFRGTRPAAPTSDVAQAVDEIRGAALADGNLEAVVRTMLAEGLLRETPFDHGVVVQRVGAPTVVPELAFHGRALRAAIAEHLAEVRRWNLPAASPQQFLDLARDHCRILRSSSPRDNNMLRLGIRRHIGAELEALIQGVEPASAPILRVLLQRTGQPLLRHGLLDVGQTVARLEPVVVAPQNVTAALVTMAESRELVAWITAGEEPVYLDPELDDSAAGAPLLRQALDRQLGLAAPASSAAPVAGAAIDVDRFKQRLYALNELWQAGLINEAELASRKAEILREI